MYLIKLFISFVYVQLVVINSPQDSAFAEITDDDDDLQQEDEPIEENSNTEDYTENSDKFYEPFDPEKNGVLLHEYYAKIYEKFPDYDTATMKQNLRNFGDVLMFGEENDSAPVVEADVVSDQFVLDASEQVLLIQDEVEEEDVTVEDVRETAEEATSDIVGDAEYAYIDEWIEND